MKEYFTKEILIISAIISVVCIVAIMAAFFIQASNQPAPEPENSLDCTYGGCPDVPFVDAKQ